MNEETCTWRKHEVYKDVWVTECKHSVESIIGRTPRECGTTECVWCGKKIKEKEDAK